MMVLMIDCGASKNFHSKKVSKWEFGLKVHNNMRFGVNLGKRKLGQKRRTSHINQVYATRKKRGTCREENILWREDGLLYFTFIFAIWGIAVC